MQCARTSRCLRNRHPPRPGRRSSCRNRGSSPLSGNESGSPEGAAPDLESGVRVLRDLVPWNSTDTLAHCNVTERDESCQVIAKLHAPPFEAPQREIWQNDKSLLVVRTSHFYLSFFIGHLTEKSLP